MTKAKAKMVTTISTPPARVTPKEDANATGPPVGLIVAPILLCVLIAALIFLWIKYKKRKNRRALRRQMYSGDAESIPSAITPGENSTHPSESESNKPLLSTSAYPSEEPVPSPGSGSESVVFSDEQSERAQSLGPIEERDDNPDAGVSSVCPVHAASGPQQRMVQEELEESVEDQDPSESGGEHEEEEQQSFRERRYDSGYRSYRTRPYYRDMYERHQPHLRQQFDCNSANDSDESEDTVPKQVVPSKYPPTRASSGRQLTDYTGSESKYLDEDEDNNDGCDRVAQEGKRLQNNVQEDSEDDSYAKKYIV